MAGTLTVQNLQGPSSGANANKIIVPSGQTFDVSGGTLTPAVDQVVQLQTNTWTGISNGTSSTSYVTSGLYIDITPVYSDSIIAVQFHSTVYTQLVGFLTIYRDSSGLEAASRAEIGNLSGSGHSSLYAPATISVIDTPATTSTVRYTAYMKSGDSSYSTYFPPSTNDRTQVFAWEIKQ
jgi:hypothetical protein